MLRFLVIATALARLLAIVQAVESGPPSAAENGIQLGEEELIADRAEIAGVLIAEDPKDPSSPELYIFITNEYKDGLLIQQSTCPIQIDREVKSGRILVSYFFS